MTNFTKNWKFSPTGSKVFPYFVPTYRYVVHQGKSGYEDYCKNLLLQDKPGCYLDNVGKNFESCKEELRDFVENYPFCPELIKDEFSESQIAVETKDEKDPFIDGDDLYVRPEKLPDNAPRDDLMHVYAGYFEEMSNIDPNPEGFDDEDVDYCNKNLEIGNDMDWNEDARLLNLTKEGLSTVNTWITSAKREKIEQSDDCFSNIEPHKLNFKQKLVYDYIINWI